MQQVDSSDTTLVSELWVSVSSTCQYLGCLSVQSN